VIELRQLQDYRFEVRFDKESIPVLVTDEGAPIGADAGPSPTQLLGTAVANCLAASLLFALRKFKNEPGPLHATAHVHLARNAQGRLRVGSIDVELRIAMAAAEIGMLDRVLAIFEDYCVVTQSVRAAIPVGVRVLDASGAVLRITAP
jgi:organic hydroperoxide reductase OsmC/OhrA